MNYFSTNSFRPNSECFVLEEFVSEKLFKQYGETCWQFLDTRMLITIECLSINLKNEYGFYIPLIINNWNIGGNYQYSGLREFNSGVGARHSQHCYGRASDVKSPKITAEQMREHILRNENLYPYITYIEADVSWLHYDVRNSPYKKIRLFRG